MISANAQVVKYSNEFMAIGVGAKSLALSGAVISGIDDVTAGYWNPAGLANIQQDVELGLMHSEYFAGIAKYDYFGSVFRIDELSTFGVSMLRFGVDNIPNTLELMDSNGNLRYDRIKRFSVADYGFLLSYARSNPNLSFRYGGNVKIIHRVTGEFATAWGFGIDAGMQYNTGHWRYGATLRDVTTTFNAWQFNTGQLEEVFLLTDNEIPENSLELTMPALLTGVGRTFTINEKINISTELMAGFTFDGRRHSLVSSDYINMSPAIGIEADYINLIYLRMGAGNFQMVKDFDKEALTFQPNMGLGIHFKNLSIDYALTDIGDLSLAYSHVFSLRYGFNIQKRRLPQN